MATQQGRNPELRAQLSTLVRRAGFFRFFAYILFNDGTVVGVSTVFDLFCSSAEAHPTSPSPTALMKLSQQLDGDTDEKPAGHLIRRCHEGTFVFYASRPAGHNTRHLLIKLEQVSVKAMRLLCPLLKTMYSPSANLFIMNNAKLRERVLLAPQWPHPTLTTKECECLHYAAQGLTVSRIAQAMHNSRHTISEYMQKIKRKLGANTISEALFYSLYLGIMNPSRDTHENAVYTSNIIKQV